MCSLPVGGIKGEPRTDIELNFITSPGFIWKGSRLTTLDTCKNYTANWKWTRHQVQTCRYEQLEYLFFFFNTLVLNKCHDIMSKVLSCSCSKHYLKRIGFHKSIVRPPEVSCKIHVDEFVADNFLELRKRAKINCFVTTIINYREENVGRNEQKRWKQQSASQRSHVQGRLFMRLK